MATIRFYSTRNPYGEFSNFSRHAFVVSGVRYQTSEHYFQAQKFAHSPKLMIYHFPRCGRVAVASADTTDPGERLRLLLPDGVATEWDWKSAYLIASPGEHKGKVVYK